MHTTLFHSIGAKGVARTIILLIMEKIIQDKIDAFQYRIARSIKIKSRISLYRSPLRSMIRHIQVNKRESDRLDDHCRQPTGRTLFGV